MASISNIYATGYQSGGHVNSSQLLDGGQRDHYIESNEGSNDCGSMMFKISRGGTSAASVLTRAYLTYDEKVDSHGLFNIKVDGTNRWILYRVNSYSVSGKVFTINSETRLANDNNEKFSSQKVGNGNGIGE